MGYPEFTKFYSDIFGDRWPAIEQALKSPEQQVFRWNLMSGEAPPPDLVSFQGQKSLYLPPKQKEIPRDEKSGLLSYYVMDPASVFAARALPLSEGDRVLDMCAAPGGKTLILAERLRGGGEIIANELSEARRDRLKKVIQQYVPREVRDRVWVTGKDGGKFALKSANEFDAILVDAPCSGERHLLDNKTEMSEWQEKRSEKLAQRQYALLTAALLAVKPGGHILYSTCALSPYENDGVIEKLLKKKDGFEVVPVDKPVDTAETTKFGLQFIPDRCGFGPIYYSLLRRNS